MIYISNPSLRDNSSTYWDLYQAHQQENGILMQIPYIDLWQQTTSTQLGYNMFTFDYRVDPLLEKYGVNGANDNAWLYQAIIAMLVDMKIADSEVAKHVNEHIPGEKSVVLQMDLLIDGVTYTRYVMSNSKLHTVEYGRL